MASSSPHPSKKRDSRGTPRSAKRKGRRSRAHWQTISPSDLGISDPSQGRLGLYGIAGGTAGPTEEEGSGSGKDVAEREMRRLPSSQRLYDTINAALVYPDELRDNDIEGVVEARLVFADSSYVREQSEFRAGSNFLRVYVQRLLRQVFARDHRFPFLPRERWVVPCHFVFEIVRRLDVNRSFRPHSPAPAVIHRLSFRREFNKLEQWRLTVEGDASGQIKGGLGVDILPWLEKGVGLLSAKKPDPLQKYRDDPDW